MIYNSLIKLKNLVHIYVYCIQYIILNASVLRDIKLEMEF